MCLIMQVAKAATTRNFKNNGVLVNPPSEKFIEIITTTNNECGIIKILLVIFNCWLLPLNLQSACQLTHWLNFRKKYIQGQFVKPVHNRRQQGILLRAS